MKKLRKTISLLLTVSMLFGANGIPIYAAEAGNEVSSGEIEEEASGFDENAHGEVVEEGKCGTNANYKLYEDEMLYIYGSGETEGREIFSSKYICNVYIENGITSIGNSLFYECKDLKTVRLPNELKNIGSYSFAYCDSLSNVQIPDSVESIGERGFFYCKNLTDINIPRQVSLIREMTFSCCDKLKNIKLPEELKTIEKDAFALCASLDEIIFPECLEIIGESSFQNCSSLTSIIIPNNVTIIESKAFINCSKLEKILIPENVAKIRLESFSGCGNDSIEFLIYCNENSEAERYAKENGITYKPISLWGHEHDYESSITKEPTCTGTGIRTYNCSCGDEYTEEIPSTGHDVVIEPVIDPTETEEGKTEGRHCGICGEVLKEQETIPATGRPEIPIKNTFNGCKGRPVNLSITCKESDEFTFECLDNCGMQIKYTGYSSIISGGFSSYSKSYELIFNNAGEHIISVYKNGNLMENDKIIIAKNHTWDSGKVDKKETCTQDGRIKYTCTNCENTKKESVSATGHNYSKTVARKATCTSSGIEKYTCSKCGDSYEKSLPATGHKYGKWKVVKKPTIFKKGAEKKLCTICGKTLQTRDIKKLKATVKISKTKLKLKKGKTYQLKIKRKSKGDKMSKWTTSNKKVVSVNKKTGKIKALKKGKAKITVTMKSGCKAVCNVTVK